MALDLVQHVFIVGFETAYAVWHGGGHLGHQFCQLHLELGAHTSHCAVCTITVTAHLNNFSIRIKLLKIRVNTSKLQNDGTSKHLGLDEFTKDGEIASRDGTKKL